MNPLAYAMRRWLAIKLSTVRLNRIHVSILRGQTSYIKTRYPVSRILIPIGNLLMRCTGEMSEVLSQKQWRDWETRVAQVMGTGNTEHPSDSKLSLHSILQSPAQTDLDKLLAVELALKSLLQFHRHQICWCDGQSRLLSHGDATCKNVCIDLQRGTAMWIDFDTRHHRDLPAVERFCDDIRALICSSAVELNASLYPDLAMRCWQLLPRMVAVHFQTMLTSENFQVSLLQLAQAPLRYEQRTVLRNRFLAAVMSEN
jgi:hypothetical protein